MPNTLQRLKRATRSLLPNAAWDAIKSLPYVFTVGGATVIGTTFTVAWQFLQGAPPSILAVIAIAIIWLVILTIVFIRSKVKSHNRIEPLFYETAQNEFTTQDDVQTSSELSSIKTALRLQFGANHVIPLAISSDNIWSWYVYRQDIVGTNEAGEKVYLHVINTLYLVFDEPTSFSQIRIDSGSSVIPNHEVKHSSVRHAVIMFDGDLSNRVIYVETIP